MSKRIIIDLRLLAKGGASGIEEYTTSLLNELLAQDEENFYSFFYNGFRKVTLPSEWLQNQKVKIINRHIPNKLLDYSIRIFNEPKLERFLSGNVVFSPHFNLLKTSLPRIITFHDLSFVHHPEFFSWRKRLWHWLQDVRHQAEEAKQLIAVSEFTKSDLVELFHINPEKIKVIYSGVGKMFQKLAKDDAELTAFKNSKKLNRPFILYLGTIEPRKNVISIIRAFNLLKQNQAYQDFELVIAGQLGWLYEETLVEARHSPVSQDIHFMGKILSYERVLLYNLASLFIYPSFFEGFGFQPLEAQACGVPVIASNRTSLPEVLGNSAILVDPWKLNEIVENMQTLLENSLEREHFISLGFENVKKFTWKRAAWETLALFESS